MFMMSILRNIPTLVFLLIAYNLAIFNGDAQLLTQPLLDVGMMSGARLQFSSNEMFILVGLGLLYIEIFKSTRASQASMVEQAASMVLFVVFLVEFLLVKQAGNSTFLILTALQFLDVMAGFTVTVSSARRDINLGH